MPRLRERLGKLKGKSIDELRLRCAQAAHARLERLGLSRDCREPSDRAFARIFDRDVASDEPGYADELLRRFREQNQELARRLPGLGDPAATARAFHARCPEAAAGAIAAAERIAAGFVDLGDRGVAIGACPDWTTEPVSGKRAPAIHWSRIAFLDPAVAGDCKLTWELNRHQYLVTLGRAYLLTNDDRYASLIADHLSSWMDGNPPKIGINWTSSLEVGLRAISWIWAPYLLRNAPSLDPRVFVRALKFLYLQARHIQRNLSVYFSPNTHLTGEALALLYIGTAFPELEHAAEWRTLGTRILSEQLERQLLGDGVYFEQSTYYHRYTTDFYLHALLLCRSTEPWLAATIRSKLGRLLDYLLSITRPDGTSPLIGDDDGGRLVMLGQRAANDFRDTLAVGAALLARGDCAYVARNCVEELLWLCGPEGVEAYDSLEASPPARTSRAFAESGYFVMRESWDRVADWALVRCGPHAEHAAAHAHADALAVELSVAGEPMLVDAGTYLYTASRAEREYFRSSAAHNTVTIDGLSSAEPATSPFKWKSVPRSRSTAWVSNTVFDFFEGEHDGYRRLDAPAVHSRAVFFLRGQYWVIRDRVRGDGRHHLALYLHWTPGITLSSEGCTLVARAPGSQGPLVKSRIFARAGELSCEQGWISSAYGTRARAPMSVFRLDGECTEDIVTVIAKSTAAVRLEECVWTAGCARECGKLGVMTASTSDTILSGPTTLASPERDEIISDARWTWVRRSLDGELLAFAIIHGRSLIIDDRPEFQAESIVDCAVGQRGPDGWHVEVQGPRGWSQRSSGSSSNRIEDSCAASVE